MNDKRLAVIRAMNAIIYAKSRRDADAWDTARLLCEEADEPHAPLCTVMAKLISIGEKPHVIQLPNNGTLVAYKNREGYLFVVQADGTVTEITGPDGGLGVLGINLRRVLDRYEAILQQKLRENGDTPSA